MAHQAELQELQARAHADTEQTKVLLKEIAALSNTLKGLQSVIEAERVERSKLEARLAGLEAKEKEDAAAAAAAAAAVVDGTANHGDDDDDVDDEEEEG